MANDASDMSGFSISKIMRNLALWRISWPFCAARSADRSGAKRLPFYDCTRSAR